MKKFISLCISLLFLMYVNNNVSARGNNSVIRLKAEVDDISYILFQGIDKAYVCRSPNEYTGTLIIPESVEIEDTTYQVAGFLPNTFKCNSKLTSIDIRCSIKSLSEFSFYHCRKLERVTLPEGLIKICKGTFSLCHKLKDVAIPNSVSIIEENAFAECLNLYNIDLPVRLNYLGSSAFINCCNLRSISVPENIKKIEPQTFENCVNLENVSMGQNIKKIKQRAFYNCVNLESPQFPTSLKIIGDKAFSRCTNIEELIFPVNTKKLGWDSFEYCINIKWIRFLSEKCPNIGESAFYLPNVFKGKKIDVFVPQDCLSNYKRKFYFKFGCSSANVITFCEDPVCSQDLLQTD